ncbi:hypothetical protein MKEN_00533300 [Mycena kentingensis (nom. inval.)]|nr:hypothetical protein MKEN_00533300 [Mycena kentingensis (nom. inval.)]
MFSKYDARLGTNYVPSDLEVSEINSNIDSYRPELQVIEFQIQQLSQRRSVLHAYVDAHGALVQWIRRIPREILEEIFFKCLPEDRDPSLHPRDAPILLCQVCSSWRAVALSTPRIWASLHISFAFVAWRKDYTQVVADWLARSRSLPLSLSIHIGLPFWDAKEKKNKYSPELPAFFKCSYSRDYCTTLIDILFQHQARFRRLNLVGVTDEVLKRLWDLSPLLLEYLEIDDSLYLEDVALFKSPRLRCIVFPHGARTMDNGTIRWEQRALNWSQITHLVFADFQENTLRMFDLFSIPEGAEISFATALSLLALCPRLEHLQFAPAAAPAITLGDYQLASTLPCLRTLIIGRIRSSPGSGFEDRDQYRLFWDTLPTMPLLQTLCADSEIADLPESFAKTPALERLTLPYPWHGGGLGFFHALRKTKYLRLHCSSGSPGDMYELGSILGVLKPGESEAQACPLLEELVITRVDVRLGREYILSDSLATFLRAHVEQKTPLRRFELTLWGDSWQVLPAELMEEIQSRIEVVLAFPEHRGKIQVNGQSEMMPWRKFE